jgi:hypothetical protein
MAKAGFTLIAQRPPPPAPALYLLACLNFQQINRCPVKLQRASNAIQPDNRAIQPVAPRLIRGNSHGCANITMQGFH